MIYSNSIGIASRDAENFDFPHYALHEVREPAHGAALPFPPKLFAICRGGYRITRLNAGALLDYKTHMQLSPVSPRRG